MTVQSIIDNRTAMQTQLVNDNAPREVGGVDYYARIHIRANSFLQTNLDAWIDATTTNGLQGTTPNFKLWSDALQDTEVSGIKTTYGYSETNVQIKTDMWIEISELLKELNVDIAFIE